MSQHVNTIPPPDMDLEDGSFCSDGHKNSGGSFPHPCDVQSLASVVLSACLSREEEGEGLRQRDSFCQSEKSQEEAEKQESAILPLVSQEDCGEAPLLTRNYYRQLLLRRNQELLQVQAEFDRYAERMKMQLEKKIDPDGPQPVELRIDEGLELLSNTPIMLSLLVRCSFREPEVGSDGAAVVGEGASPPAPTPRSMPGSRSSSPYAAMYSRPPPREWTAGASEQYEKTLHDHENELKKIAEDYERYAAELAKRFKRPPVVIPPHLVNSFADTNVIVAKDHNGRMDLALQLKQASPESPSPNNNNVEGNSAELQRVPEGDELPLSQQEQLARFTIESLANGDICERDALSGQLYWEAEPPTVPHYLLPSRLLDERVAEVVCNYRFYSRRWGEQWKELAAAVGGEQGAELLHRYETREYSLLLPPKCRRDFFESAVDYDTLLQEQEFIMEVVERNLMEYRSALLDKPPSTPHEQLPPVESP
ncbi:hypothetical protein TraAM80_01732 [Trypanosoma rangeli]|uniref:Uncharacterized protein n=1 Tax=Trypanosoma rangeli TaxID=5698 RepID=A0A422NXL1_TRYRA|nr:uncharacterized protein TraAM80_01732 [Trypanosoma rangeli]RNF10155.1 hypothetical protein TraAM80_01732 [Trypanosoma rangeli]|eukprot:RNF10155.1 hypothetical protein TraAM80_01732 [Trypanosoma rangeli]